MHTERLLEELIYEHISEIMPFEAVRELHQRLELLIGELGFPHGDALTLAHAFIDRAMQRVAIDPRLHQDLERVVVVGECPI